MEITVFELVERLMKYPAETKVKFQVGRALNPGLSICSDFGFITESTPEVHGLEIIIRPSMIIDHAGNRVEQY